MDLLFWIRPRNSGPYRELQNSDSCSAWLGVIITLASVYDFLPAGLGRAMNPERIHVDPTPQTPEGGSSATTLPSLWGSGDVDISRSWVCLFGSILGPLALAAKI